MRSSRFFRVTCALAIALLGACRGGCSDVTDPRAASGEASGQAPEAVPASDPAVASGDKPRPAPDLGAVRAVEAFPKLMFERPTYLASAPGVPGRLFVLEQAGRIQSFEAAVDTSIVTTFLDLRDRVRFEHNEEGLLGLAFDPTYAETGAFYVYYSASKPRQVRISRFTAQPGATAADADSETILLTIEQPWGNHNGGMIAFGPDGKLYAGIGDGGAAGDPHDNAQNLATLLGSIIRIDVDPKLPGYRIPPDNPFVARESARGEIWAFGLRNPWRFSFDPATGRLWAGDVGQDQIEEVDVVERGGNYGWRIKEGTQDYADTREDAPGEPIDPVAEYDHIRGLSITGGYVYRGKSVPRLRGAYVFADYARSEIMAIDASVADGARTLRGDELRVIAHVPSPSSFGEDAHGELYVVSLAGKIWRFAPPEGDAPPAG